MKSVPDKWISHFLGVGYRYQDVYMNLLLLFDDLKNAISLWNKTIDLWSDDKTRLRFIENEGNYWCVLYNTGSNLLIQRNIGFIKKMKSSQNYERFKDTYENKIIIRFASYKEKIKNERNVGFELKLSKKFRYIYDVQFIDISQIENQSLESKALASIRN
jgi:hypothetical protein